MFNAEEFNTVEMKLYQDLRVIQDTLRLVNGAVGQQRQERLFREKVKVG